MTAHQLCGDPACGACNQARATAGFRGEADGREAGHPSATTCPECGHRFVPQQPVRLTESVGGESTTEGRGRFDPDQPRDRVGKWSSRGGVGAAGGSLAAVKKATSPGKARSPRAKKPAAKGKGKGAGSVLSDTKGRKITLTADDKKAVRAAKLSPAQQMTYTQHRFNGMSHAQALKSVRESVEPGETVSFAEAWIDGRMSFSDIQELVRIAVRARVNAPGEYRYVWLTDLSATDVVYQVEGSAGSPSELFQCSYTLDVDTSTVELGEPVTVVRTYAPVDGEDDDEFAEGLDVDDDLDDDEDDDAGEQVTETEARESIPGRVLEAKGKDKAGNRIFRIRVIAYGDSKNLRRYPESVMRAAAPLYNGAKIYDHHRTEAELATGTIAGMVGYLRNVEAGADGIEADAVLLPSAVQAAEALDASLAAQAEGLAPVVGFSHDVMATYKPLVAGATRMQEATSIVKVNSADIVSDPAAGGQATRMVAGGITQDDPAGTVPGRESTKETDVAPTKADVLAALQGATAEELAAVGLSKATTETTETKATESKATETTAPAAEADGTAKDTFLGRMMIQAKVSEAFPAESVAAVVESVTQALPDRITEAAVDTQIAGLKSAMAVFERADLTPRNTAKVTQESLQKKVDALDAFFAEDFSKGYRSFKEAFVDFTGLRPRSFDEDFNRTIMQETFGNGYSTGLRAREGRMQESLVSSTWSLALGDSITRRMIADYQQPSLQTWRKVVSSMPPVNDFRTQRIERIGGYGTLPVVNEGQPYQPLTSPTGEEATYLINKKGGTEDLTLEMIANDDIRSISKIPSKLGLAAAQTLYRFVWGMFVANAATTYDATALFHASHGNTDLNTLSQSNLSAGRAKMRQQTAYGDSSNVLSIVPRTLIVPSGLEELAYQLSTSAVAIPATPAGPSNTPNLHQGLEPIVVDYWSSQTGWFLGADPGMCPTIEIGFYQGRQDPELFTQADQTVGSMFDADKMTLKIRHIYSGAVLEHRGLYRGNA